MTTTTMGSASNGWGVSGSTMTRRPAAASTIPRVTNAAMTQVTRTTRNYDLQNGGSCPRYQPTWLLRLLLSIAQHATSDGLAALRHLQPRNLRGAVRSPRPKADHGHPPTLADDGQHQHPSSTSLSKSLGCGRVGTSRGESGIDFPRFPQMY